FCVIVCAVVITATRGQHENGCGQDSGCFGQQFSTAGLDSIKRQSKYHVIPLRCVSVPTFAVRTISSMGVINATCVRNLLYSIRFALGLIMLSGESSLLI